MLRIRRNLQPRIPNLIAVPSALLLLALSFMGMDDPMAAAGSPSSRHASVRQETMEASQSALPDSQSGTRRGLKISLMLFH